MNPFLKKFFGLCFLLCFIGLTTSCVRIKKTGLVNWDRSLGLKQRVDVNDKKTMQLTNALQGKGVSVVSMGQDYRIKMPASMLFGNHSPKINWSSFSLLGDVAALLGQYRIVNLYVETHVNEDNSNEANKALAVARAREIADFLSRKTDSARIIVARGYNQTVIKEDKMIKGSPYPSDVVISFRNRIV